jgi:hypothetical protein
MTKRDYINRVLLIMNEAGMFDSMGNSILGADDTQVDRHIEGSYVDAWRRCVKVMPRAWFKNMSFSNATLHPDLPNGTGYVELPGDFYLLTRFRMNLWAKAVYIASIENEKTASIQSNEYTRGSTIRPVCTISNKEVSSGVIKEVLNYYSLPKGLSSHVVEEALYIPVCTPLNDPSITDNTVLDLDLQLVEPMAYMSASGVFTMFEKYDIAKALELRAAEMFPGLAKVRGTNITINQ